MQGGNREQLLLFDMLGYKGLARSQTKFLNNLFQSNGVSGEDGGESVSHERELVLKKRVTAAEGDSDDSRPTAGLNRKVVSDFGVDVRKFSSVSGVVLIVEPSGGGGNNNNKSYDQSDLRPGDVLVAVNGVEVTDMDRESVLRAIAAAAQESGQCTIKVSHKTSSSVNTSGFFRF